MSVEEERAENLKAARSKSAGQARSASQNLKKIAKSATPAGALSLASQINLTDFLFFGIALTFALLKDILDLVGIGSLPAIGTVITLMASFVIGICLFALGASSGTRKTAKKTGKLLSKILKKGPASRYALLFGGTIFEFVFGLNFLPIETAIVIITFMMVLSERKEAAEAAQEEAASGQMQESYA